MRFSEYLIVLAGVSCWWSCGVKPAPMAEKPVENLVTPSGPLFQVLDSAKTGLGFINRAVDSMGANILIYNNFYNGAGIAIGDINNDGWVDLYFGGNQTPDKLFLNLGQMRFMDISEKAGLLRDGGWTTGVNMVDVNGDGWLDIYVSKSLYDDQPNLRINELYINQGDTTFKELSTRYGLNDFWRTQHANWFDYDRDGDLDCYLVNQPPNPGLFSPLGDQSWMDTIYGCRLMENRDSIFVDVTSASRIGRPGYANSAVSADFNGDRWPDLYVTNDYEGADFLFLNQKDGTFTDGIQGTGHIGYLTKGCDVADLNNDGFLDILTTDLNSSTIHEFKYLASGLDAEGAAEVEDAGGHRQVMGNALQVHAGLAQDPPAFYNVAARAGIIYTGWTWSVLAMDADLDGYKDLFYTSGTPADLRNIDAVLATDKYLQTKLTEYVKIHPETKEVDAWDFLKLEDLLKILPASPGAHHFFKNQGDLTFTNQTADWGFFSGLTSPAAVYADLDNDGDLDLITNNLNTPVTVYENRAAQQTGNRSLTLTLKKNGQAYQMPGVRADIYYGGKHQTLENTSARGFYSASDPRLIFGVGKAQVIDTLVISWPEGSQTRMHQVNTGQTISVDVVSAGPAEVALVNKPWFSERTETAALEFVHQENTYNDFVIQPGLPFRLSRQGPALAVGDINANDIADVFVGGAISKSGVLYRQYADGTFYPIGSQPWSQDAYSEDVDAAFFDADADGDQDLYVVSGGVEYPAGTHTYQDRLYLNDGTGIYKKSEQVLPEFYESGSRVLPADMDGDGDLDLLVTTRCVPGAYPAPANSYLLKNQLKETGRLTYTDVTGELAPDLKSVGTVTSGAWIDFDGDKDLDMVLAGDWMPVTMLKNEGGRWQRHLWSPAHLQSSGWWTALQVADLDQDGDQDVVLGNAGNNHLYAAYALQPLYLISGELDTAGTTSLLLAYKTNETFYPVQGYGTLSSRFKTVQKKYSGYRGVAQASVTDIFGADILQKVTIKSVNQWRSQILENTGGGQFIPHDLPVDAQNGPVHAILVQDMDDDGRVDLLLAGNNFHTDERTIRQDALNGVVLKNLGALKFSALPPSLSGLYFPWQVQSMAWIRVKQQPALLLGCNNDRLRLWTR